MRIRHPKSLLAAALLLLTPIKNLLAGLPAHPNILYFATMVLGPFCAFLCLRHAVYGTKPLMGEDEAHTSFWLGGISTTIAAGLICSAWIRRSERVPLVLIAALYAIGGAFFLSEFRRERQAENGALKGHAKSL